MKTTVLRTSIHNAIDVNDIPGKIFRVCKMKDLGRLKVEYSDPYFKRHSGWTLKQLGQLWVVDNLLRYKPKRVLEIGAGVNTFFDDFCAKHKIEYWMCDQVDPMIDAQLFQSAIEKRKNTNFLRGFFASDDVKLESNFFDMVFSISTLEHVPNAILQKVYEEQARVLTKDGHAVHTLDSRPDMNIAYENYLAMDRAGYIFSDMVIDLMWRADSLVEELDHLYSYCWYKNLNKMTGYIGTVLIDIIPNKS